MNGHDRSLIELQQLLMAYKKKEIVSNLAAFQYATQFLTDGNDNINVESVVPGPSEIGRAHV